MTHVATDFDVRFLALDATSPEPGQVAVSCLACATIGRGTYWQGTAEQVVQMVRTHTEEEV